MNNRMRGALASLVMGASMMAGAAVAQDKTTLATEKDKVSYAIGLDVATGRQLWQFDPRVDPKVSYPNDFTCRGVTYWRDPAVPPAGSDGSTKARTGASRP